MCHVPVEIITPEGRNDAPLRAGEFTESMVSVRSRLTSVFWEKNR